MNKQGKNGIEWCDATWSPISGCYGGCDYCYARKIAMRFEGKYSKLLDSNGNTTLDFHTKNTDAGVIYTLDEMKYKRLENNDIMPSPYPFGFTPTFHRYRLSEPQQVKKPQRIFVCSMADLFGVWVPDSWIQQVFAACEAAPQHTYMFLTKNPKRYEKDAGLLYWPITAKHYFGITVCNQTMISDAVHYIGEMLMLTKTFLSIEPIQEHIIIPVKAISGVRKWINWVIIGSETGNRKKKIVPDKSWIDSIAAQCKTAGIPVFMKESLRGLMGEDFVQEWPAELIRGI